MTKREKKIVNEPMEVKQYGPVYEQRAIRNNRTQQGIISKVKQKPITERQAMPNVNKMQKMQKMQKKRKTEKLYDAAFGRKYKN